jgi:4-hydroxybenzoate polyprenyltransferase
MSSNKGQQRNVLRGVYQLARLHTREAWVCWAPAIWGACVAAGTQDVTMDLRMFVGVLFGIWASVTATHCTFCTFNDICDRNLDAHVDRCKTRPLPAGMISLPEAIGAFIAWMFASLYITRFTLGEPAVAAFVPIWVLSAVYPFMKRLVPFPQLVLGAVIGAAVFPGWAAVTREPLDMWAGTVASDALPLFAAGFCWVVYFDIFYATQDAPDDKAIGVLSMAVLLGDKVKLFLGTLGVLQVAFWAVAAHAARLSTFFWITGVGVWAANIPWHLKTLNLSDRNSGGKVFKANIMLGLYMSALTVVELALTRVDWYGVLQVLQERGLEGVSLNASHKEL